MWWCNPGKAPWPLCMQMHYQEYYFNRFFTPCFFCLSYSPFWWPIQTGMRGRGDTKREVRIQQSECFTAASALQAHHSLELCRWAGKTRHSPDHNWQVALLWGTPPGVTLQVPLAAAENYWWVMVKTVGSCAVQSFHWKAAGACWKAGFSITKDICSNNTFWTCSFTLCWEHCSLSCGQCRKSIFDTFIEATIYWVWVLTRSPGIQA